MIEYILNFFKGILKIKITGAYLERFFNVCATRNIKLWNIKRDGLDTVYANILVSDYKKLRDVVDNTKCSMKIVLKKGAYFEFLKIRKRYVFLAGFVIISIFFYIINNYLFDIQIKGTEKTAIVMQALNEQDVKIFKKLKDIDIRQSQNEIIKNYKEFLWIAINIKGNTAFVEVLERDTTPEIVDKSVPCDIYADKSGLIDSIDVLYGEKLVDAGQTFNAGDKLVDSLMKSYPQVADVAPSFVHSIADIKARIWYDFKRVLPLDINIKNYTGNEKKRYSIIFSKKSINLFKNSGNPYMFYDKIVSVKKIYLSDSLCIPIYLKVETYKEYTKQKVITSNDTALKILKENAFNILASQINGDIISKTETSKTEENVLSANFNFETLEQIGIKKERTDFSYETK